MKYSLKPNIEEIISIVEHRKSGISSTWPHKIARKRFILIFWSMRSGEQHEVYKNRTIGSGPTLSLKRWPMMGGCACCPGTMCLPSTIFLRHFSLAVTGLLALLSRFLERALYKHPEWINQTFSNQLDTWTYRISIPVEWLILPW